MSAILGQRGETRARCVRIGLINNMPDAALARTERQFRDLLAWAAPGVSVQFSLFSLPGIPRNDAALRHLETNSYRSTDALADVSLDACVVTGTEPRQSDLENESYWPALAGLFDRLERGRLPLIFSCLAAHAAVLHFSGLRRRRLPQKRFGVFEHVRACHHLLTDRLPATVKVAHSRCNEIPADMLDKGGYRVLTIAPEAGADLFVRRDRENWLFFQGHPEYDADALGREFQRDVKRYLSGERKEYPSVPGNYFPSSTTDELKQFEKRARAKRCKGTMAEFPSVSCMRSRDETSGPAAAGIFGVWLQDIVREKYAPGAQPGGWATGERARKAPGLIASVRRRRLAQLAMLQG
jgi:homoserine O-succinyltransferase